MKTYSNSLRVADDVSVKLLTEAECQFLRKMVPHNTDISLDVWAAWFSAMLKRHVGTAMAQAMITEYNEWRVRQ